jgi:uncharacterized OB-fold protein
MPETNEIARPLPEPTCDTAPHFKAAAEGRLDVPRCEACKTFIWQPQQICPSCLSDDVRWHELSGLGTVFSYTIVGRAVHPWFQKLLPYALVLVEFPDAPGIRLLADMQGSPDSVKVGMQVRATFEKLDDGLGLIHFEPA